jgi:iron complex outermembrane receptor protein
MSAATAAPMTAVSAFLAPKSRHQARFFRFIALVVGMLVLTLSVFAQSSGQASGKITGVVTDQNQSVVSGAQVILTNLQTKAKSTAVTNGQGVYFFESLQPGAYAVQVDAKGFKSGISANLNLATGQTVNSTIALAIAPNAETVDVSAGTVENAYRVDTVKPGTPLGTLPILDLPYSVNVISRQLIDDTQSRNFKEAAKYLPLVSFQEMQGPEVLRPESRGMQGTNMQNDRKDGMGIAVTTPSAMEEYEQLEVFTGLGGAMYGPTNPSGMFNFVTKRPTDEQLRQLEVQYEGSAIGTVHADLGGRFGAHNMFGYRTNLVIGDGTGYVTDSQLRRQLASMALDMRISEHTVIEGNFSYYNLFQHGYPGWFSYNPTLTGSAIPKTGQPYTSTEYSMLPVNAPDPTRQGYGQSFSGVDLNNQIGEVRIKHDFGSNWHLVAGVLNQVADRNINTAVNAFYDTKGDYQTFLANTFSGLAPRFQVKSDLGYLNGKFKTWGIGHDVVIGSTGYRFSSWGAKTTYSLTSKPATEVPLCTAAKVCATNISDPLVDVNPGLPGYAQTTLSNGIYVSSIIHQQGFSFGDTITLTPHLLLRVAASQDWTWTNNYQDTSATKYLRTGNVGDYMHQGVSPSASLIYKPRSNMTIYGTFADSIQAPDVAPTSTASVVYLNSAQPLAPYRSTEGEIGYKLVLRRINFSTAMFRIERPFADAVQLSTYTSATSAVYCGTTKLTAGQACDNDQIVGNQVNYGVETMLSGRIFDSLMVTGGLVVLNPKLTDTVVNVPKGTIYNGVNLTTGCTTATCPTYITNNKDFVGIPAYKSNILAEYHLPVLVGAFLNADWQHVGRRPVDDINSYYVPQYNTFDVGIRYTAKLMGKIATWRVTANNISDVHYWSTLGPGSITGGSNGSYLGHLGEPRLITASMRYDF